MTRRRPTLAGGRFDRSGARRRSVRRSCRRWSRSSRSRRSDRRSARRSFSVSTSGPGAAGARPAHSRHGRDQRHARFLFRRRPGPRPGAAPRHGAGDGSRRRRPHRPRRRIDAARRRRRWTPPRNGARHAGAAGPGAARQDRRSRSTPTRPRCADAALDDGAAIVNDISGFGMTRRWARSWPRAACRGADAHARPAGRHVCPRELRRRRRRGGRRTCTRGVERASDCGVARNQLIVDPGLGFAKRAAAQLGRAGGHSIGLPSWAFRSSSGRREVVPDRRHRAAPARGARLGHRRRRDRRRARRRPHRARPSRRRRWSTSSASPTPFDSRRAPRRRPPLAQGRICLAPPSPFRATAGKPRMNFLTELLQRPPVTWWDVLDILIVSILVYELLEADPRHARGADGGRHRVDRRAVLPVPRAPARNPQLADPQHCRLRRVCGHRADAGRHPPRARPPRPCASLFRRFDRKISDDDTVEELVVAATTLSAKKTGAIIVIERSIGLRNYIESGIPLDATLTYDLLVSIFQPTSPLHDGAVIVQGDRVAAAACFLPLTINPRLSRELGSRHRAAIGVTEENDAVAIVVSEETGDLGGRRRRPRTGHRRRAPARAAAGPWSRCGAPAASSARPGTRSADGVPSLPQPRPEVPVDLHRRPAVAGGGRRTRRRARDARAGRVPEPAGRPRAGRQSAGHGGGAAARSVGRAEPHGGRATCRR